MNKTCFVLVAAIIAINSTSLFAGETVVTHKARHIRYVHVVKKTDECDFRHDIIETSVATDPSYMHFKDYPSPHGVDDVGAAYGDPTAYIPVPTVFKDYPTPAKTVDELLALIEEKLNRVNCPEVEFTFDEDTGDIRIRYVHSPYGSDWSVNIRDVKARDFIWTHANDNYSPRLGQMERRKFHTASEQDAQDIDAAFAQIRTINGWQVSPY